MIKVCLKCRSTYRTERDTCPVDGAPLIDLDLSPGTVLAGKYRIEAEIGRGGMGVVYRGVHIIMDKTVAVKVISPLFSADPKSLEMFKSEARALGSFYHPNVLTVHDFGLSEDGRYYLVMELLRGESLKSIMTRSGSIPPERAFSMLTKVCDAVAAAHRADIIHLDLKGENVIVSDFGGGKENLKVLDFGLAVLAGGSGAREDDGTTMGTVGYMAPEQIMDYHVDKRADIYALGVLAFEMLAGKLPFPGGSKTEVLDAQVAGKTIAWPKTPVLNVVPRKARKVILAAIQSDPDRRPESVEELGGVFSEALAELRAAAARYARRHGVGTAAGPSLVQKATSALRQIGKRWSGTPQPPRGMVYITPGPFIIGSNKGQNDQHPAARMFLPAFFIDVTPVTNRDYVRFIEATEHEPPTTWKTLSYPSGRGAYPVTGITWYDARDYARWVGKRLPSEAEWEKAARGTDGRRFPWGRKAAPTSANWRGNPNNYGKAEMKPVGSFPMDKSPYGCLDMAGNVMEWTFSWYKAYKRSLFASDDYGEKFKVVRGGGYLSFDRRYLMCAHRSHARPGEAGDIGFRCAKSIR